MKKVQSHLSRYDKDINRKLSEEPGRGRVAFGVFSYTSEVRDEIS